MKRDPRPNAPTWAVKPLYQQGEASYSTSSVEQVEQELTSTPVSASSSGAVSSRQLSFSNISGEMPEGTVTSECELDGLQGVLSCVFLFSVLHACFEVCMYVCMYVDFQLQNTDKRVYAQAKVWTKRHGEYTNKLLM